MKKISYSLLIICFGINMHAQNLTGSSLNLTDPDPVLILNSTSAGQYIDDDGTNRGWPHIKLRAYDVKNGPLVDKWDITYSVRENNLYFYNYVLGATQINFSENGNTSFPNGNVGIGTTSPNASLEIKNPTTQTIALSVGPAGNSHSYFKLDKHVGKDGGIIFTEGGTNQYQLVNNTDGSFALYSYSKNDFVLNVQKNTGNIGIGTTSPSEKLSVDGTVLAKKVKVSVDGGDWPDFVFAPNFKLRTLNELEAYIKTNQHLPEVPSAKEVEENGLDLGKMDATLLQKVEELTLYTIAQEKKIEIHTNENSELQKENQELKTTLQEVLKRIEKLESYEKTSGAKTNNN